MLKICLLACSMSIQDLIKSPYLNIMKLHRAFIAALLLCVVFQTPLQAQSLERKIFDEMGLWENACHQESNVPNLFANATITCSPPMGDNTPDKAIDGRVDVNSYWAATPLPCFYQLDMGAPKDLSCIKLWLYWKGGRIYQYLIEGSLDGKEWNILVDKRSNSFPEDERGISFDLPPSPCRYVRVTIVNNKPDRRKGGHIVEIQGFEAPPADSMQVTAHEDQTRFAWKGDIPRDVESLQELRLKGWKGERVNGQLLVRSVHELKQLHCHITWDDPSKSLPLKAQFLKFTQSAGEPRPDIISNSDGEFISNPAGVNRSIWLSCDLPQHAAEGDYCARVSVYAKGMRPTHIPVHIKIKRHALPASKDWKIHLDLWQYPDSVARAHAVELWSDEHFMLMKPLMKRLADAGQKAITCTIIHEAWNAQNYDHCPSMIQWIRGANGQLRWDYSIFDRWVSFMMEEVGITQQISCYTMLPWSMKVRVFDEVSQCYVDELAVPGTEAYEELWAPFLQDFSRHLAQKNWLHITGIGLDERPDQQVQVASQLIYQNAPKLKIVSAINRASAETSALLHDMSPMIPYAQMLTPKLVAQRKAEGKKTTFYVCMNPAHPNTFTYSPLIEAEWLGMFAAVHDLDGFLRWAYNAWNRNPFETVSVAPFPDGDCHYVYPGNLSTPRFEKLRDGFEEFEKLNIIRKAALNDKQLQSELDQFIRQMVILFDKTKTAKLDYGDAVRQFLEGLERLEKYLP